MNEVNFQAHTTQRNELELPRLHFIVMDNWLDVIGEQALIAWLRFYSWCDRSIGSSEVNKWEQAKIRTSLNKLIKKLGVGKGTFYNKILKPLWDVGLIDIEEYEASLNLGQKPMNIIVYKYPNNNINLQFKPLEKVRNYDKDYCSRARTFAKQGGRPKTLHKELNENHLYTEIEPPLFQDGIGSYSEIEPNNMFNESFNSPNDLINYLNNINNNANSSSSSNESESFEEDEEVLNNLLFSFLKEKGFTENTAKKTVTEVRGRGITKFTIEDIVDTFDKMEEFNKFEPIIKLHTFFANGLESAITRSAMDRSYQDREQRRLKENLELISKIPRFNWLEQIE
ncbi:hypothetical protein [Paenibacillus sp. KR2-11]|uniref:hypothetical protein n=1 Tax=Paenibacillus sp. KR2-11 TaxID=3385500 RepID=UPI0038FCFF99